MKNYQARRRIVRAWRDWGGRRAAAGADEDQTNAFWDWLRENRNDLLDFEWPGDKRQLIHSWIALDERKGGRARRSQSNDV